MQSGNGENDVGTASTVITTTGGFGTTGIVGQAQLNVASAIAVFGTEDDGTSSGADPTDGVRSLELTTDSTTGVATGVFVLDPTDSLGVGDDGGRLLVLPAIRSKLTSVQGTLLVSRRSTTCHFWAVFRLAA